MLKVKVVIDNENNMRVGEKKNVSQSQNKPRNVDSVYRYFR